MVSGDGGGAKAFFSWGGDLLGAEVKVGSLGVGCWRCSGAPLHSGGHVAGRDISKESTLRLPATGRPPNVPLITPEV